MLAGAKGYREERVYPTKKGSVECNDLVQNVSTDNRQMLKVCSKGYRTEVHGALSVLFG